MADALLLNRGLPMNRDIERFCLAQILLQGNQALMTAAEILSPGDFGLHQHETLFRTMLEMDACGVQVERINVLEYLKRKGDNSAIGPTFLLELEDGMPRIADFRGYIRVVKDKSTLRRAIYVCREMEKRCFLAQDDPESLVRQAEKALHSLSGESARVRKWWTPSQVLESYPGALDGLVAPRRSDGLSFPWQGLNMNTCGMRAGEMILLAARPSMGKSSAALQIALAVSEKQLPVAYVSLEMSKEALVTKLLTAIARVDSLKMRQGYLSQEDRLKLVRAAASFEGLPLWINDTREQTVDGIRFAIKRKMAEMGPFALIVLDHFHLVRGLRGQEDRQRFNEIADSIQGWGQEFNCATLTLCQLGRDCERENRAPRVTDLKETGKLEEDADTVLLLHRPEQYAVNRQNTSLAGLAQMIVGKQRNGPTGVLSMVWLPQFQLFREMAGVAYES